MDTLTISHEVNRENIEKAIAFISTLEENSFTRWTQTNHVGQHCVLGHLAVNPDSPFYDESLISFGECTSVDSFAIKLNNKIHTCGIGSLAYINNVAPENGIKNAILRVLTEYLESLN